MGPETCTISMTTGTYRSYLHGFLLLMGREVFVYSYTWWLICPAVTVGLYSALFCLSFSNEHTIIKWVRVAKKASKFQWVRRMLQRLTASAALVLRPLYLDWPQSGCPGSPAHIPRSQDFSASTSCEPIPVINLLLYLLIYPSIYLSMFVLLIPFLWRTLIQVVFTRRHDKMKEVYNSGIHFSINWHLYGHAYFSCCFCCRCTILHNLQVYDRLLHNV